MSDTQFTEATHGNHIPAAVLRAGERANELARQVGMSNVPAVTTVVDPPAPVAAPPAATTVVDPPAPVVVPPVVTPPNFEQQYLTLQGKYNAEVPSLRAEVTALQRVIATMHDMPAARAAAQPPPPPPSVTLDPADVETYGEDLIKKTRQWARAEVSQELAELRTKFEKLEGATAKVSAGLAGQSVQTHLDADPEIGTQWRVINEDPAFHAWLAQADWQSGAKRSTMLNQAFTAGDAIRTGKFFKAFLSEHTAAAAGTGGGQGHTEVTPAAGPTLESLAAPGRGTATPPAPPSPEQQQWTRAKIAAFYRDVQRGVYRGRDADKLRTEQDIHKAVGEGRVT